METERFVEGVLYSVIEGCCPLLEAPYDDARQTSQLLFGENFMVYEEKEGWLWGQNQADSYVGYTRAYSLTQQTSLPTHWITALATFVYQEPDIKSYVCDRLSFTSEICVTDETEKFFLVGGKGWVYRYHTRILGDWLEDHVKAAESLLGVPYLWGGRSSWGIDCSGLLQLALAARGVRIPRDSDMQQRELGYTVTCPQHGDFAFFQGHCGILGKQDDILHANAFTMSVVYEPLEDVMVRIPDKFMVVKRL